MLRKGASYSVPGELKDVAGVFIHHKQIARLVKAQTFRSTQLGKGDSPSGRSKFGNLATVAVAPICHKKIARDVKGQIKWIAQPRRKGASQSGRSEPIDLPTGLVRRKQIARDVKGQSNWSIQPRGKGASRSGRTEFIDVADIRHKQIARPVKSQTLWVTQS